MIPSLPPVEEPVLVAMLILVALGAACIGFLFGYLRARSER